MFAINVTNIVVLDNPSKFVNPFQFEVTFECLKELKDDLEWKCTYVGSAENEKYDQVLDSILVGPVPMGVSKFVFQADAPDASLIPPDDLLGVTVVLITCSYKDNEFIRVGYYVNNDYASEELNQNPPEQPQFDQIRRSVLAEKPRVTRFPIEWD